MSSRLRIVNPGTTRRQISDNKIQLTYYLDAEDDGACECGVCWNSEVRNCNMVLFTKCGHSVCKDCMYNMVEYMCSKLSCPYCRDNINKVVVQCGETYGLLHNIPKVFK